MAATQIGDNPLNLYAHWSRILNLYIGRSCNHIKATKTIDPNGNVIDESQTETTIYGAVSPVSMDAVTKSAGLIQLGDLIALFLDDAGVLVGTQTSAGSTRYDMIEYEDIMYTVVNKRTTAYDSGVPVISKYVLRKVADE